MTTRILQGDCREILPTLDAASFHAVVTDPPYELGFMGRAWDSSGVTFRPETWAAVLRVLKPGGHMLCFGGTRTQHRMACAIEDAGFEIRDTLCWIYGSGFPKSLDVSKTIDRAAHLILPIGAEVRRMIPGADQAVDGWVKDNGRTYQPHSYVPAAPEAVAWTGWGSALKPAFEPILLCRKPLDGTIAANVLRHGVGGINIDACRVDPGSHVPGGGGLKGGAASRHEGWQRLAHLTNEATEPHSLGRFPANVLHDGSDEVMAAFAAFGEKDARDGTNKGIKRQVNCYGSGWSDEPGHSSGRRDTGTAARFFYSAKADKADRADSKHPTVKPLALMEWLVKLITPPDGLVLDPFAGSGITAEACMKLGFDCTLIDIEAGHVADIQHRIKRWSGLDAPLFAEPAA